nr:reverse transcriptase domain-containing protein [Tanacetum cinerariifolium]
MRTRSSSNHVGETSMNPNSKGRNRRRSKKRVEPFSIEEAPVVTMVDQRTMAELLHAPTEGYVEAIVVPHIPAEYFELKHSLINLVTSKQFFGFKKEDPHAHIGYFNKITSTLNAQDVLKVIENKSKVRNSRNKLIVSQVKTSNVDSSEIASVVASDVTSAMTAMFKQHQLTPAPAFVKAVEESCVTCGGAHSYRQCPATDGNTFSGYQDNIQGYVSAVIVNYNQGNTSYRPQRNNFNRGNTSYQAPIQQTQVATSSDLEKFKKTIEANMQAMRNHISNLKSELRNEMQSTMQNQNNAFKNELTNDIKNMMASFFQMNTASSSGSGPLLSNTIANPKGELKAITTQSVIVLDGPSILMPPPFINPEEDERAEEKLTDQELTEYTIKVPPPLVKKPQAPSQKSYEMPKRDPLHPNIPYPSSMYKEKQQGKDEIVIHKFWQMFKQLHINITIADALILIPKYQKILKALLSNKEKLLELENTPLNENFSEVILKKLPEKFRDPGKFLIPCGFSELMCKALTDLGASINLMPLSVWKKLGLPKLISTQMTLELANWSVCTPTEIARDVFVTVGRFTFPTDFIIVDYEIDPQVSIILGRPFLRTTRALIDVYRGEWILHDGDERLILNMKHDTSSYSNKPQRESMIDIYNISYEDYLKDLFANEKITNHLSGNPTFSSEPDTLTSDLTSLKVKDDIFDPERDIVLIDKLLNLNSTKDLPPSHNTIPLSGSTTSSSHSLTISEISDYSLEEFADELTLIESFSPGNDDMTPKDVIREIEYLLNHDPLAEYSPNNDLIYTIPEMFTDEHTLDYSSPPRYDDPFDSKENKIKDSKLLIDELDSSGSSSFVSYFLESDSVLYVDFYEVDTLTSTNNEDKVFNPGILVHKNLYEVTNRVAPDKNVKKISSSNASLFLEDYNHLLSDHELPFHIEIPRIAPDFKDVVLVVLSFDHSIFTSSASFWESNILD